MQKSTPMGMNRTGKDMSPVNSKAMVQGAEQYSPLPSDGHRAFAKIASQYIRQDSSVGSIPVPGTTGAMTSATGQLTGHGYEVFLNKLGERLAYERSGVRLYESFIRKCEALNGSMAPLPMKEVLDIRNDEEEHFFMLQECMYKLGADPTAQTPDADISGVAASGLMKVINDPRTSISQSLEALLTIELTDNAAWELLIKLSSDMGLHDMTERFRKAQAQEILHLERVRNWYETAITTQISRSQDIAH